MESLVWSKIAKVRRTPMRNPYLKRQQTSLFI